MVRDLIISNGRISFNTLNSNNVSSDIQFYFTGENKIEGYAITVLDPVRGVPSGTVFKLEGLKVE